MAKKMYKNLKLVDRMERFVTSELGFKPIDSRNKYRMFERTCKRKDFAGELVEFTQYLFLGDKGAVRVNSRSKNAAESTSLTEKYHAALKQYETLNNLMETTI